MGFLGFFHFFHFLICEDDSRIPRSKGTPGALVEAQMLEIMELSGRPESNKKVGMKTGMKTGG
jgi:hypothetical protein